MATNTESSTCSISSFARCSNVHLRNILLSLYDVCRGCSFVVPMTCKMIALCRLCFPPIPLVIIHLVLHFFDWIKCVIVLPLLVLVLIVGLVVWCGRSVVLRNLNKWAISSHSRCCCCCSTRGRDIWISCCH